jgi:hypothetical protein
LNPRAGRPGVSHKDSAPVLGSGALRVFLTCWLVYLFFWTPYLVREHFLTLALVEDGSFNVERYATWTGDIFRGPRGGAYINNNPGASLAAAAPLALFRPLLTRVDRWNRQHPGPALPDDGELFWRALREGRAVYFMLVEFLTVALLMAPATAGTMAFLCARLVAGGIPAAKAQAASLLCGLATPVLYRTAYLNHNLLMANAGLTALLLLWKPQPRRFSLWQPAMAGLLAGFAVLCDFSGLVVVAVAGLYALAQAMDQPAGRWRTLTAYSAGVLPGIAALMLYQAYAFGSFYKPSQQFMTPTAPTVHGFRGIDWPSLQLMWANFVDPRFGLFAYCPVLLLAFAAPFLKRVRYRMPPREMWILLLYFVLFVLFCAANQYSWLQPLTGFRYLVPVVPALALLAFYVAQALPRVARWLLGAIACGQSFVLAAGHENTLEASWRSLWQRHGSLLWMVRLNKAGLHVTWVPVAAAWLFVTIGCIWIWRPPFAGPRIQLLVQNAHKLGSRQGACGESRLQGGRS